jgi:eukaryotic-like serine/threonine-protein kinase
MVLGEGELLGVHTDVYLLGAILHHILTGRAPHQGETVMQVLFAAHESRPPEFDGTVPEELARICRRAMAADSSQRYPSCEALQRAIGEFLRYRASRELVETAVARLVLLRQPRTGSASEHSMAMHRAYTEGRFAFEQALQIWPENPEAHQGREEMIRLMACLEIEERNPQAAGRLLSELNESDPTLQKALELLERQLAHEEQEVEAFRQRQFDEDLEIGRRRRAVILGFTALLGGLAPLSYRFFPAAREIAADPSHALYLGMIVPFFAFVAFILFLFVRSGGLNEVNRRIVHLILLVLGGTTIHRLLAWGRGVDVLDALAQELVLAMLLLGTMSILLDRRIFLTLIPYGIALPLVWLVPSWTVEIYSLTQTAALLILATPWWLLQRTPTK